jgi:hypothetical protein
MAALSEDVMAVLRLRPAILPGIGLAARDVA